MKLNIWLKGRKVVIFMGGDIDHGKAPVITGELQSPQILIEPDKNRIEIKEVD